MIDLQTSGTLAVLLGKGDGTFRSSASIALPAPLRFTVAPAVADLNRDGKVDVVLPLFASGQTLLAVLLGNGDGTFQAPTIVQSTSSATTVVITDLNGDGKPDLVLGSCCGLVEGTILYGNGDGTFQPELPFPSGPDPTAIVAADLNGDGLPDLAVVGRIEGSSNPNHGTLAVLFNAATSDVLPGSGNAAIVSAANSPVTAVAPGSLAVIYGNHLAAGAPASASLPLPTTLAGTSVSLVDSAGMTWQIPLLYVSAAQVNFYLPSGIAAGTAQVTATAGDGTRTTATAQIAAVAPGLFALNAQNLAAAVAIKISADGTQQTLNVYALSSTGAVVASPVSLGSDSDKTYLVLFGTGFHSVDASAVSVTVGSTSAPVLFAGPQGGFAGLDQVNVLLPHSLAGSGDVTIRMSAAGLSSNTVHVTIQ